MTKIITLVAVLTALPLAAGAQTTNAPSDSAKVGQPNTANADASGNRNSSSSQNTPTSGETTGRNNPSIDRAPDNVQSRGTAQQ